MDFLSKLFDTSDFPARWDCGRWTDAHGWLHILSDLGVFSAYFAIPLVLGYFVVRRKDLPFRKVFFLFGAFILLCGLTHLMEAIIFWWPGYRVAGLLKLATATVSWITVLALVPIVPKVLAMRTPEELETEIKARLAAEGELQRINADLEKRVEERTAKLTEALASLREERELLRTTLASIGDGVIVTDRENRVTFLNPIAEQLTGWTTADASTAPLENVFNIISERTHESVENPAVRAVTEGVIVGLANHTLLISKDGTQRPIDDSAAPIRSKEGKVVGCVLVFRDIGDRKRADRRLVESEARYRAIGESIDYGVWVCDRAGRNTYASESFLRMVGITQAQCSDFGWGDVLHPDDAAETIAAWKECARTEGRWDRIHRFKGVDGLWHHVLARGVPLRDESGQLLGWAGINLDISRLMEAEQEIARLAAASEKQRRLYETVLTNTPDFMYVFSLDHRVLYANEALIKMWGRGYEGAIGKTFLEIGYEPWHAEMHDREIDQVRATKQPIRGQVPFTGTLGRREYDYIFVPVIGADGEVEAVAGTTRDVTERHEAEAALRESEERRRLALDAAELGAWHIDLETNILTTDERFRIIFTGTTEAMDNEQAFAAIHEDDRQRIREAVAAATRSADPVPYAQEYRVVHPDGSVRWVFAKGRTHHDRLNPRRLSSFDGTVADITARKLIDEERERLVGQLREQDRRKDEFLATLAHELRNPLAPIRNGLEVMRIAGSDGTIEQTRAMMERQLTQLVRLVDDLLDIRRVTSGKLKLRREPVELRAVIDAALETSQSVLEQAGHSLTLVVPDEPIIVDGDATRLAQVVSNLLHNAAKYTDRGGHIRLEARRENGMAVLEVADDGIGIPPDMLEKVFEMFVQVDRALEKTTGGLGIGLSLVKGVVELHGGTVEARSEGEGLGSSFIVRLPAAEEAEKVDAPVAGTSGSSNRRRILIADDNVDAARSLQLLLQMRGNEVKTAKDGLEATEIAESLRPEIILLDIGMPRLNGYETCRKIRELPWGKSATIIAMTGWGQDEDKRRSQEAGFDHHLVKPVGFGEIEKLLASGKGV